MTLARLAQALGTSHDDDQTLVSGISHRADWLEQGFAFVAIRGARFDGHQFLEEARARGAVVAIGEGLLEGQHSPIPYLTVKNARIALAEAAAALHNHPSRELDVIGVTGTDGKTTTSCLAHHLLEDAGRGAGLLSTVGYRLPQNHDSSGELLHFPSHFTTPEAPQVQATLREMHDKGAKAVVLESSSHALSLERIRGISWDVGIWTQLTSEHLDFHGTVENYFLEKKKLIERSPFAVLNADDPHTEQLRGIATAETTYSIEGDPKKADWNAIDIREEETGISFLLSSPSGTIPVFLPMIGRFNVANALAAAAAVHHLGVTLDEIAAGLRSFAGAPGRMQIVPSSETQPRVIVDFAHTPPSLEKVLQTLRPSTTGKLYVVIGAAGGQRDPSKRAPLGEVATRLADHAYFTEEDHRDTPLDDILQEMERGAGARNNFSSIPDRREAIWAALSGAKAGDTVLLAGKGTEDTLERTHETIPWNETQEAEKALQRLA